MNRASHAGYEFVAADAKTLPSLVRQFPTALLPPPEFRSMSGRSHGTVEYGVTLHLISAAAKDAPAERMAQLDKMERDALTLFSALSELPFVARVENLQLHPAPRPLTNYGDNSLTATATIVLSTAEHVLTIPADALVEQGNQTVVYTGYDEEMEMLLNPVIVTVGCSDGEQAELLDGLAEGQTYYYAYYDTLEISFTPDFGGGGFPFG